MITFQQETYETGYPEAAELIKLNYAETDPHNHIPIDLHHEAYMELERIGMIKVYTARDEGTMVGYAVFLITKMLHHKTAIHAAQDVLYIHPKIRGKTVGYRFIKWVDERLLEEGVNLVTQYAKVTHPAMGRVLESLGYVNTDLVYQRRLKWE